jgi:hypothetical protein
MKTGTGLNGIISPLFQSGHSRIMGVETTIDRGDLGQRLGLLI